MSIPIGYHTWRIFPFSHKRLISMVNVRPRSRVSLVINGLVYSTPLTNRVSRILVGGSCSRRSPIIFLNETSMAHLLMRSDKFEKSHSLGHNYKNELIIGTTLTITFGEYFYFSKKCLVIQIQPISKPTKNTKHHKNWLIWTTPINGSVFQNFEYMSSQKKNIGNFCRKTKTQNKKCVCFLFHPCPPKQKDHQNPSRI